MASAAPAEPLWKNRFIDYFVVCGLGLDLKLMDGTRGFHGMKVQGERVSYMPTVIDRLPVDDHKKFKIPEMLQLMALPGGLHFYSRGCNVDDPSSFPKAFPIILTEGDGTKVFVSALSFRDPVDEDVAQAYSIPPHSFADKCLCIVSHWPFLDVFADIIEQIHRLCFLPGGSPRPIWDVIESLFLVPLPSSPGQSVIFNVDSLLLSVALPSPTGLPSQHISFHPLLACLDVDNILRVFTALLLEKRVLLLGSKFKLLTLVGEALTGLLYPLKWMFPYIPVLPVSLLELLNAPGIFMYGICTAEVQFEEELDGVLLVDIDNNCVTMCSDMEQMGSGRHNSKASSLEEGGIDWLPPLPEPEGSALRASLLAVLRPRVACMEAVRHVRHPALPGGTSSEASLSLLEQWGPQHDERVRHAFLKFFATVLQGFKDFALPAAPGQQRPSFDHLSFLKQRSFASQDDSEPFLASLLSTNAWFTFCDRELALLFSEAEQLSEFDVVMERCAAQERAVVEADESDLAAAGGMELVWLVRPDVPSDELLTVKISDGGGGGAKGSRYVYHSFPASERMGEQETRSVQMEKAMRAWLKERRLVRTRSSKEKGAQREMMKMDTQLRVAQLWDQLMSSQDHPLANENYGTLYGMIESDVDGYGGAGFLSCLSSLLNEQGWSGELTPERFLACKELMLVAATRAGERRDYQLAGGLLEIAGRVFFRNEFGVVDFMRRYLGSLHMWHTQALWDELFNLRMEELGEDWTGNISQLYTLTLKACAFHMVELGIADRETWNMLLQLVKERGFSERRQTLLRGQLSLIQHKFKFYGAPTQTSLSHTGGLLAPQLSDDHPPTPSSSSSRGTSSAASSLSIRADTPVDGRPSLMSSSTMASDADMVAARSQAHLSFMHSGAADSGRLHTAGGAHAGGAPSLLHSQHSSSKRMGTVSSNRPRRVSKGFGTEHLPSVATGASPSGRLRQLSGHCSAVTAVHAGTREEMGDLLDGVHEGEEGYFVTGSADGVVKLWNPNPQCVGSEMRATMRGHKGPVRCISSDRDTILTGGDDSVVMLFDKLTSLSLASLPAHESSVACVRFLSGIAGSTAVTAGLDGCIHVWDVRSLTTVATAVDAGSSAAVLCLSWCEEGAVLGSGHTDGTARVWDLRAGKEMHFLEAHTRMEKEEEVTNWVSCIQVHQDVIVTGSRDWTAKVWLRDTEACEKTITAHGGAITAVDYCPRSTTLTTGSADGVVRFWKRDEEQYINQEAPSGLPLGEPVLALRTIGDVAALGTATSAMSFLEFSDADVDSGRRASRGSHVETWNITRATEALPELARHIAVDMAAGRMCVGGHNGSIRLWDAFA